MRRNWRSVFTVISLAICIGTCLLWAWSLRSRVETTAFRIGPLYFDFHSEDGTLLLNTVVSGEVKLMNGQDLSPLGSESVFSWRSLGVGWWCGQTRLLRGHDTFWGARLRLPDWLVVLLTALAPIAYLRRRLRRRADPEAVACPQCGYDLRATPDRCPECGCDPHARLAPSVRRKLARIVPAMIAVCYFAVTGFSPLPRDGREFDEVLRYSSSASSRGEKAIDLTTATEMRCTISDGGHFGGYNILQIAPDGNVRYQFVDNDYGKWAFRRTTFRLDEKTLEDLRALLHEIRFAELDSIYAADIYDGTQLHVTVSAQGAKKTVCWSNYFPSEIERLREFRDRRILDAHATAIREAEVVEDSRAELPDKAWARVRHMQEEALKDHE